MVFNINLQSNSGLPVCLSGITNPISFSIEKADHDRRRKVFKKMKSVRVREASSVDQEIIRLTQRSHEGIVGDEDRAGDLARVLHDLSCISLTTCTAKAA